MGTFAQPLVAAAAGAHSALLGRPRSRATHQLQLDLRQAQYGRRGLGRSPL
jgi:hypothetical protein